MTTAQHFTGTYGTLYYVKDMGKSVNFYKESFGFKTRMESPEWTELEQPGGQAICLHKASADMKTLPGGIMILNVVKMKELLPKLKATGVRVNGEPHNVHGDEYTVDFKDLDGNLVSLYGTM